MITERLLTYGLKNSKLHHVLTVANGLTCDCTCANCGKPLVAKNNLANKKQAHFAHHSGSDCSGAYETVLHLLAKKIFLETRTIHLPDYHHDYNPHNTRSRFHKAINPEVVFDEVILEKKVTSEIGYVIPDAIASKDERIIYVEFANSHFVDESKKRKLKSLGCPCIEIDLAGQELDEVKLYSLLNDNSPSKYWICHPQMDQQYNEHLLAVREKKRRKEETRQDDAMKGVKTVREKFQLYSKDPAFKIFKVYDDTVYGCPKRKIVLYPLQSTEFYNHAILGKIINGSYWNGMIYGYLPNGKWIYFNKEKIVVYPPDPVKWKAREKWEADHLFHGLTQIKKTLDAAIIGDCPICEYCEDHLLLDGINYEVCKHPMR